jgi:hypothetical protein
MFESITRGIKKGYDNLKQQYGNAKYDIRKNASYNNASGKLSGYADNEEMSSAISRGEELAIKRKALETANRIVSREGGGTERRNQIARQLEVKYRAFLKQEKAKVIRAKKTAVKRAMAIKKAVATRKRNLAAKKKVAVSKTTARGKPKSRKTVTVKKRTAKRRKNRSMGIFESGGGDAYYERQMYLAEQRAKKKAAKKRS